eukprot:scaffold54436_cov35-Prasinocladus_malaysianus.AAC.2
MHHRISQITPLLELYQYIYMEEESGQHGCKTGLARREFKPHSRIITPAAHSLVAPNRLSYDRMYPLKQCDCDGGMIFQEKI